MAATANRRKMKTTPKRARTDELPLKVRQARMAAAGKLTARNADRHWLYEQSVQNASNSRSPSSTGSSRGSSGAGRPSARGFLRHGRCSAPSGWPGGRATPPWASTWTGRPWTGAAGNNLAPLGANRAAVTLVQDDVRNVTTPAADVVAATNFSWWGFKTRAELRSYFQSVRASLRPDGMLLLDCFGGPEAQVPQVEEREQDGFSYMWDQDDFNPITHEIRCLIHFGSPTAAGSRTPSATIGDCGPCPRPATC